MITITRNPTWKSLLRSHHYSMLEDTLPKLDSDEQAVDTVIALIAHSELVDCDVSKKVKKLFTPDILKKAIRRLLSDIEDLTDDLKSTDHFTFVSLDLFPFAGKLISKRTNIWFRHNGIRILYDSLDKKEPDLKNLIRLLNRRIKKLDKCFNRPSVKYYLFSAVIVTFAILQ